ncbi:bifunctional 5,10-methylenetetrahydrofolate dehydrogenase/5,10-methenyltetrahydrofolate cyclohydrolase [bacterium]|nr:bifunctional 5,10-methylenetetrahydrofolate dehydrogenase/5,10-methenyltetrahydrofolate cyclohydrolase [bacterium]
MLLKGNVVAKGINSKIKEMELPELVLAVFHPVGDESAESYLRMKEKKLAKAGFAIKVIPVENTMEIEAFYVALEEANKDDSIHGIMVELPLPIKVSNFELSNRINPLKDVDGVTFANQGTVFATREEGILPCTALASALIPEHYDVEIAGKSVLVIGRSAIVGLPLAKLFLNRNATVTVAHSRTPNLAELAGNADIIAIAAGVSGIVTSSQIKDGATVVDVGINFTDEGKLVGDFTLDQENEAERINYTPVPGGVGVVTNAVLIENLVRCYKMQQK